MRLQECTFLSKKICILSGPTQFKPALLKGAAGFRKGCPGGDLGEWLSKQREGKVRSD